MAERHSIEALIHEHWSSLQFSRLTPAPIQLSASAQMHHWIGEYHPHQYHAIEVVGPNTLQQFQYGLQQSRLYRPESLANVQPGLIIFADGTGCDTQTLEYLQQLPLPTLQTPVPLPTVLRNLAYTLAEHGRHQLFHGVMLTVCGEGVLLAGDSGAGKSGIALELVSRGHHLVADDTPLLHRLPDGKRIFAVAPPLLAELLEVRALGILNICKLFGPDASLALAPVDLVIEFVRDFRPSAEQRLQAFSERTNILGVDIHHVQIPIGHVTNPAILVETMARNHVLYKDGYAAGTGLSEQQQQLIDKQTL